MPPKRKARTPAPRAARIRKPKAKPKPRVKLAHPALYTSARKKRFATVYDAVASRVSQEGFIPSRRDPSAPPPDPSADALNTDFKKRRSSKAVPADEVLGRRLRAGAARIDYADEAEGLPNSDLLIAIHQYVADFYERHRVSEVNSYSMEESALLAFGILVEETARELLGEGGHLALVNKNALLAAVAPREDSD